MAKKPSKNGKGKDPMLPKRKRGGQKLDIDGDSVAALAGIGCTQEEIGTLLGCSTATVCERFAESYKKGMAEMRSSLRHRQFQAAMAGENALLIWLGKQHLGQVEPRAVEQFGAEIARVGGQTAADFDVESVKLLILELKKRAGKPAITEGQGDV